MYIGVCKNSHFFLPLHQLFYQQNHRKQLSNFAYLYYLFIQQFQMGRKKIQINLIKNTRLRNITYNKRKKGLLKKIVEMSKLCGLPIKLQYIDIYGNLITLKTGLKHPRQFQKNTQGQKIYHFTSDDYPQFKLLDKIKKKPDQDCQQQISQIQSSSTPTQNIKKQSLKEQQISNQEGKSNKPTSISSQVQNEKIEGGNDNRQEYMRLFYYWSWMQRYQMILREQENHKEKYMTKTIEKDG